MTSKALVHSAYTGSHHAFTNSLTTPSNTFGDCKSLDIYILASIVTLLFVIFCICFSLLYRVHTLRKSLDELMILTETTRLELKAINRRFDAMFEMAQTYVHSRSQNITGKKRLLH